MHLDPAKNLICLFPVVSQVKLLGIDASGIADGVPSVVLNLVWNIILYFQVVCFSPFMNLTSS